MKLYSKKTIEFTRYEQNSGITSVGEKFIVHPGLDNIIDAPDWIVNDPMFGWAKDSGDIQVFESSSEIKKAEKKAVKGGAQE